MYGQTIFCPQSCNSTLSGESPFGAEQTALDSAWLPADLSLGKRYQLPAPLTALSAVLGVRRPSTQAATVVAGSLCSNSTALLTSDVN